MKNVPVSKGGTEKSPLLEDVENGIQPVEEIDTQKKNRFDTIRTHHSFFIPNSVMNSINLRSGINVTSGIVFALGLVLLLDSEKTGNFSEKIFGYTCMFAAAIFQASSLIKDIQKIDDSMSWVISGSSDSKYSDSNEDANKYRRPPY